MNHLRLVNNSIEKINLDVLAGLSHIKTVDLSQNNLKTLSDDVQKAFAVADSVDVSNNNIFSIITPSAGQESTVTAWRELNLSNNLMRFLQSNAFLNFPQLKMVNISHNALVNVENSAFKLLGTLETLDLSSNELQNAALQLPDTIHNVFLGNNSIRLWPLEQTPSALQHLDLHGNELSEIFPGHETITNLKVSQSQ